MTMTMLIMMNLAQVAATHPDSPPRANRHAADQGAKKRSQEPIIPQEKHL